MRAAVRRSAAAAVVLTATALQVGVAAASLTAIVLFSQSFADPSLTGTGNVVLPAALSGTDVARLTGSGDTAAVPLPGCPGTPEAAGGGALRLTSAANWQMGGLLGAAAVSMRGGLNARFISHQYGGSGADGVALVLAAVDPADPRPPGVLGSVGGALGYTTKGGGPGLARGYLGVGLDVYGEYAVTGSQGASCPNAGAPGGAVVGVRGPGHGMDGY